MRRLAFILVPLLVLACDREPAAPDLAVTPDFGATVTNETQYAWPSRITWLDSEGAWDVLLLGYDPADDYDCHGGVPVGGIPVRQHVVLGQDGIPLGSVRDQTLVHTIGRPPLYMYLRADFPPPGATSAEWCAFLTTDWVAAGTWSATMSSDNDVSGFDGTPGINSWGGAEAGVLLGKDGTRYIYEWKYRGLCDPDLGCRTTHTVDHVRRVGG